MNIADNFKSLRLLARFLLVIMLLLIPFAALAPDPGTSSEAAPFLHFFGMAWVAFLACLSFETNRIRLGAIVFVFAYSALMELIQHYLPFRHGTWEDVGINGLGCLMGVGLFIVQRSMFKVKKIQELRDEGIEELRD